LQGYFGIGSIKIFMGIKNPPQVSKTGRGLIGNSVTAVIKIVVWYTAFSPAFFIGEPVDLKYVPSSEDIDKIIAIADSDTQDYLWTISETMGRVSTQPKISS